MTEQELRALVREAIATQAAVNPAAAPIPSHHGALIPPYPDPAAGPLRTLAPAEHASHFLFMVPTGSDADGPCLIEPAVPCTHCGYCRSYGH